MENSTRTKSERFFSTWYSEIKVVVFSCCKNAKKTCYWISLQVPKILNLQVRRKLYYLTNVWAFGRFFVFEDVVVVAVVGVVFGVAVGVHVAAVDGGAAEAGHGDGGAVVVDIEPITNC